MPLYGEDGNIRTCWQRASKVLKTLPEDLVPQKHHRKALSTNKATAEVDFTYIESMIAKTPDELMIEHKMQDAVHEQLATLPQRLATVIQLRFGLSGEEPMELKEVGEVMGITGSRARQLEQKALCMLKLPERRRKLKPFVVET